MTAVSTYEQQLQTGTIKEKTHGEPSTHQTASSGIIQSTCGGLLKTSHSLCTGNKLRAISERKSSSRHMGPHVYSHSVRRLLLNWRSCKVAVLPVSQKETTKPVTETRRVRGIRLQLWFRIHCNICATSCDTVPHNVIRCCHNVIRCAIMCYGVPL